MKPRLASQTYQPEPLPDGVTAESDRERGKKRTTAVASFSSHRMIELEVTFHGFEPTAEDAADIKQRCLDEFLRTRATSAGLFHYGEQVPGSCWPCGYSYRLASDNYGKWKVR